MNRPSPRHPLPERLLRLLQASLAGGTMVLATSGCPQESPIAPTPLPAGPSQPLHPAQLAPGQPPFSEDRPLNDYSWDELLAELDVMRDAMGRRAQAVQVPALSSEASSDERERARVHLVRSLEELRQRWREANLPQPGAPRPAPQVPELSENPVPSPTSRPTLDCEASHEGNSMCSECGWCPPCGMG